MKQRILAATPLISIFLFLAGGFILENWLLGATFFLLIPLSWILLTGSMRKRINQSMPFISLLVFLWLAIGFDLAHPGWVVFFAIPITDTLLNGKFNAKKLITLVATVTYLLLGFVGGYWHPGWLVFLLIPIINILFFPNKQAIFYWKKSDFKSRIYDFVDDVSVRKKEENQKKTFDDDEEIIDVDGEIL